MALDRFQLLAWLIAREREQPDVALSGREMLLHVGRSSLGAGEAPSQAGIVQAAGLLKAGGMLTWRYADGEHEPASYLMTEAHLERCEELRVTDKGYEAARSHQPSQPDLHVQSSALRDLAVDPHRVDLLTLLDALDTQIDAVSAPQEARANAHEVVAQMRGVAQTVGAKPGQEVLAAAARSLLGL